MRENEVEELTRDENDEVLRILEESDGWMSEEGYFVSYYRGENDETYFQKESFGSWFVRKY